MNALRADAQHTQNQTITPRMQHAVKLLLMSTQDFNLELQQQLDQNPFLEGDEDFADADATDVQEQELDDTLDDEAPDWTEAGAPAGGSDVSAVDFAANSLSLREHLLRQLCTLPLPPRDRALATAVVHALDDDGYLRQSLEDLAHDGVDDLNHAEWEVAVKVVQSLEPRGVAARSLSECLRLQLEERPDAPEVCLARKIVADHLEALARLDWVALAQRLHAEPGCLTSAVHLIKQLDPRPGNAYGSSTSRHIVPDVTVRRSRGRWTVRLNHAIVPRVKLSRTTVDLFCAHRRECRAMGEQLRDARWALSNIEQRLATIEQVAVAIVKRQQGFFEHGPIALKPMFLRDVADELGMHESTVSRVTNNKYMATPCGVFELKYFFARALPSSIACGPATTAVREVIREMFQREPGAAPLSDAEIARRLERRGLKVARRTVTKYRQQIHVPAVELRRAAHRLAA
jgi:RNA polymerase sigma-54 factor